jgi:hypothetical protein
MSRRRPTKTYVIYLLCHAIVFLGGVVLAQNTEPMVQSVGASLIAAGVVGYVIFVYLVFTDTTRRKLAVLTEYGIVNAFPGRGVLIRDEYTSRLRRASRNIDILGFGLSSLREDYGKDFANWAQRGKLKIRILLLDPSFPSPDHSYASQRDVEERSSSTIEADVRLFVQDIARLKLAKNSFDVRLYQCLPSVNIFRIDDELFWGPYLIKGPSRNSPTFLVKKGGELFDRLGDHFELIWKEHSREVPSEWRGEEPQ